MVGRIEITGNSIKVINCDNFKLKPFNSSHQLVQKADGLKLSLTHTQNVYQDKLLVAQIITVSDFVCHKNEDRIRQNEVEIMAKEAVRYSAEQLSNAISEKYKHPFSIPSLPSDELKILLANMWNSAN